MVFKQHPYNANPGTRPATPAIIMLWAALTAAVCFSSTAVWAQTFIQEDSTNPLAGVSVGEFATPFAVDLDGDGDLDILMGNNPDPGTDPYVISYYENEGDDTGAAMVQKTGTNNPLNQISESEEVRAAAADFTDDNLPEVIVGQEGELRYFLNVGTVGNPSFEEKTGGDNPFNGLTVDSRPCPSVVDYDGDGDVDVFIGQVNTSFEPEIILFKNTGTASSPSFALEGAGNPFNGVTLNGEVGLAWGDLDGDTDFDAVIGDTVGEDGTLRYFENTGTTLNMVLAEQTGLDDPFAGLTSQGSAKPAIGDFEADTDLDILVGYITGEVLYYQNEDVPASGITLSATVLPENEPKNTVVGTLGHTNATYTEFSLVNNSCGEDNSKFSISASDELLTTRRFSYEQQSLFHIEVQARDSESLYDPDNRCFVVRVTDERELFPSTLLPLGLP